MPIQVKTMRDLWNQDVTTTSFTSERGYPSEILKHYTSYLARKQAFTHHKKEMAKIFSDYKKRLGKGGFL